jgi:hypothetical protein
VALFAAAVVVTFAGAACASSEQPTPIFVVRTPGPTPIIIYVTPTPNVSTTGTPGATFTLLPTLAPSVSPTPEASPSSTASPTATVSAGPTSPAAFCTGTPANQAFFLEAVTGVKFTVYCATKLGSGWGLAKSPQTTWSGNKSGGTVLVYYQYRSTAIRLEVCEGTFAATDCSGNTGAIGTASFGGLSGELDSTADGFAIRVAPGTSQAYTLVGHNVTQSALVGIGADLKVVPKS